MKFRIGDYVQALGDTEKGKVWRIAGFCNGVAILKHRHVTPTMEWEETAVEQVDDLEPATTVVDHTTKHQIQTDTDTRRVKQLYVFRTVTGKGSIVAVWCDGWVEELGPQTTCYRKGRRQLENWCFDEYPGVDVFQGHRS